MRALFNTVPSESSGKRARDCFGGGAAPAPKRSSSSFLSRRPAVRGDDENDEAVVGGSKKRTTPGGRSFDDDEEAEGRGDNQQSSSSADADFLSPKTKRRPAAPGNSLYRHFPAFVTPNTFSVAEGGSASAPSSMADPRTNLSYASAASGVSSVSNDTSGSGFAPNEQGRSLPSSLQADFLLSPQFCKAFERYAHQRGDPSGNAASASADDDKGDGGDWIDGDSHDDFPSPDPYVEATFTKYQEFINNVTIASHFHRDPSRCRSLLAALATALVRYFCRPPSVEAQAARNKCMLSLI